MKLYVFVTPCLRLHICFENIPSQIWEVSQRNFEEITEP